MVATLERPTWTEESAIRPQQGEEREKVNILKPSTHRIERVQLDAIRRRANDRVRFNRIDIDTLRESIKTKGLIYPPVLRPNPDIKTHSQGMLWELITGDRRLRAVTELGWRWVDALVMDVDTATADDLMWAENAARRGLSAMEEAWGLGRRASTHGWSPAQLAEHTNLPASTVADRLLLLRLHADYQDMLLKEQFKPTYAVQVARHLGEDRNYQALAVRWIIGHKYATADDVGAMCIALKVKQSQQQLPGWDEFLTEMPMPERIVRAKPFADLPEMRAAKGPAVALVRYSDVLRQSDKPDHRKVAEVVDHVRTEMERLKLIAPA